jgi:hypothetical protein
VASSTCACRVSIGTRRSRRAEASANRPRPVVEEEAARRHLVGDEEVEVPVAVEVGEVDVLRVVVARRQVRGGGVDEVAGAPRVVEPEEVLPRRAPPARRPLAGVADDDVGEPVAVHVADGEAVADAARRQPVGGVDGAPPAGAEEELVRPVVLGDEQQVGPAVAVEVGGEHVLAVVRRRAERALAPR